MMPLCTTASRAVAWGWALFSVGRPWVAQRVWPMPTNPVQGLLGEASLQIAKLALGAAALEAAFLEGRDPRGIIAAVFEALQRFHEPAGDRFASNDADDPAHLAKLRMKAATGPEARRNP